MTSRAAPFHCPYCGDENLRPSVQDEEAGPGAWECHSCLRTFVLTMTGQLPRPASATRGGDRP